MNYLAGRMKRNNTKESNLFGFKGTNLAVMFLPLTFGEYLNIYLVTVGWSDKDQQAWPNWWKSKNKILTKALFSRRHYIWASRFSMNTRTIWGRKMKAIQLKLYAWKSNFMHIYFILIVLKILRIGRIHSIYNLKHTS